MNIDETPKHLISYCRGWVVVRLRTFSNRNDLYLSCKEIAMCRGRGVGRQVRYW